jgi:DNA polymerase III delta prime subunit
MVDLVHLENNKNMDLDKIWSEKYRPQNIEDLVLSDDDKRIIQNFIKNDEIPNLLFYGNAGTGKTTAGKILISALDAEDLFLNCAEVGIDEVRNTISSFSKTKSFNGKRKIVFLDEIDSASPAAQRGLRNTMEENAGYCRYILTSNYIHNVIVPLQSRCQTIQLSPPIVLIFKRIKKILDSEKIEIDDDNFKKLAFLIKKIYPDIRKIINETQKYCINGVLNIPDLTRVDNFTNKIIDLLLSKKIFELRKYIIENENDFKGDYNILMKSLFDTVCDDHRDLTEFKKKMWLITIGEYMYRSSFVVDHEINFYCLLLALNSILEQK